MLFKYVLLATAAVSGSAAAATLNDEGWYVQGKLTVVNHAEVQLWDFAPNIRQLKIGTDVCPDMSNREAAVFMKDTSAYRTNENEFRKWSCLNLVDGTISRKYHVDEEGDIKIVRPAERCTYGQELKWFQSDSDPFGKELTSYLSHFRQAWFKKSKGHICGLRRAVHYGRPAQLTPTTFNLKAFGDDETELVAKIIDKDNQVLGSTRVPLVNRSNSEQYVEFNVKILDVAGIYGKNTTLKYGLVPKNAPLANAFHHYSVPFYFTRPDRYAVKESHFVLGQKGRAILDYEFDLPHEISFSHMDIYRSFRAKQVNVDYESFMHARLARGNNEKIIARQTTSSKQFSNSIVVPKGKGSLEFLTEEPLDPKKYTPGQKYTIVVSHHPSIDPDVLDEPHYPDFKFSFSVVIQKKRGWFW